ncbi:MULTISPECIES: hypothetical protein [Pacificibacter]|uniref:hypothetical protein n=1 Tax=Pacificibacter TaxID=1042323 RepID=UPI001C08260F|nr:MULTISPECIES: hypothetical protein [Pacificibacter]MBU2935432.1 hypothetical protein [Pacificibacter marinus]MDO6615586.1 hypothetical protein [Pacificibacter sp. 1_MG-2023]
MFSPDNGLSSKDYAAIGQLVVSYALLEKELFSIVCSLIELEEGDGSKENVVLDRIVCVGKQAFGQRVKKFLKLYAKRFGEDKTYHLFEERFEQCQKIRDHVVHGIWTSTKDETLQCQFMSRNAIKCGYVLDDLIVSRSDLLSAASDAMIMVNSLRTLEKLELYS